MSLKDEQGRPKNDFANEAGQYYSETAIVVAWMMRPVDGVTSCVYGVQTDDGNVLELTEDCLMAMISF